MQANFLISTFNFIRNIPGWDELKIDEIFPLWSQNKWKRFKVKSSPSPLMKAHNTDDIDCSECKAYYFVLLLWSLDNYPGTDLLIERSPVSLSSLLSPQVRTLSHDSFTSLQCSATFLLWLGKRETEETIKNSPIENEFCLFVSTNSFGGSSLSADFVKYLIFGLMNLDRSK